MEFGSVLQFLENKSILVTGATGFLAKIFLEKVLRVQPNVKKLYLLLRAADAKAATHRFHNEVIAKELFRVLKEKCGTNLNSIISEKTTLVPGDITFEDLGLKDSNLREEMLNELDVVINLAATTNFDERYDVALGINTLGAKNVINFSKKCAKLKVVVHVSTAYVSGERSGIILEKSCQMGESLNGASGLDIDVETKVIEQELNELQAEGASDDEIKHAMKELGLKRANMYGWPNTYVFTKAMGEMLVDDLKENMSVVTIRPTVVTSTFKEPFPGWAEGIRTIDSLAVGYGKGRLTCFVGDPTALIDAIPADMVVNAIIVAMVAHAKQHSHNLIYQVGSSSRNPLRYSDLQDYGYRYFTKKPLINKDGEPIRVGNVKVLSSMATFNRYMALRYMLPLKGLELVNTAFCQYFKAMHSDLTRKVNFVMRLVELYRPYLFFNAIFDDKNTVNLITAARDNIGAEIDMFYFDSKCVDWDNYFMNTHIPGVVKHVFK